MKNEIPSDFLSEILRKWGDTWWFKVLFFVLLIYFISIPIITPIISNKYQQENISQSLSSTLDGRDRDATRKHRAKFEVSRQAYAIAKHKMSEYLPLTKCEYIFLLEFHNGAENVMTGIQFCRFDMTLEVATDNLQYVPLEKFKDDIVARYDILISDELSRNKVIYCKTTDFEKVDRYLAYQMSYVNAKSYAAISLKDKEGKIFGAVLAVSSNDEDIDLLAVKTLATDLEDIFLITGNEEDCKDCATGTPHKH